MVNILFHPIMVHFPIAFYFLELLLLFFWVWKRDANYRRSALFVFKCGYLGMLAALATGLLDTGGLDGVAGKVRPHFFAALTVVIIYTARAFLWRRFKEGTPSEKRVLLGGALAGVCLVCLTAYYGGRIVYGS